MNENQKAFLDELDKLLKKYQVDSLYGCEPIVFQSNGQILQFAEYKSGEFRKISSFIRIYKP